MSPLGVSFSQYLPKGDALSPFYGRGVGLVFSLRPLSRRCRSWPQDYGFPVYPGPGRVSLGILLNPYPLHPVLCEGRGLRATRMASGKKGAW